jgi:Uma2 family endonuclease
MVATKPRLTPEEYLAIERRAETKSEYLDGEMFPMTGGSFRHNVIVANLVGELYKQLEGRSLTVVPSDLRVRISATGLYTYPDVAVVAGKPVLESHVIDVLLNPLLIVEVLSPTTEAYDRGKKFEHYKTIDSLAEYVLVFQDTPHVEQRVRQDNGDWHFETISGLDQKVILSSIGCELALAKIYLKVLLEELVPLRNPVCRSENPLRGGNNPC